MVPVSLSSDCWKRWAICFTVLALCVHSEAVGLLKLHGRKVPQQLSDTDSVDEKWIEQPIDHFNDSDTRTWKMRYMEKLDLWKENGPVYVYINGEDAGDEMYIMYGVIADLATETDGALYLTEHRYYGLSQPFDEVTPENFAYLSSKQALADIANVIKQVKTDSKFKASKVVIVGGSYAGSLAAWFKLLYPDLADAAIASSAPVLAKKDYYEYLENVGDDIIKYGSHECFSKINDTFHRYEQLLQTSEGQEQLKKELKICNRTDLNNDLIRQVFFADSLPSKFLNAAQYGTPAEIRDLCLSYHTRTIQVISNEDNEFWNEDLKCNDYDFQSFVSSLTIDNLFPWTYQTCTEFGYFMTTTSGRHPFTNNIHVNLYTSVCSALFGADFNESRVDEGVKDTNELYGGLHPNVSHVVFVNGDMDPWHRLGVLEDLSPDAPAKVIPGASHCSDLDSITEYDTPEQIEAKKYVKNLIKTWIGANIL